MTNQPVLIVKNLVIKYGVTEAINSLNFTVNKGEILGLVGNNGSGKTSVISSIMKSVSYSEGDIFFNGENILKSNKYKNNIGYLPEDVDFFEEMTGNDFLKYMINFRSLKDCSKNELVDFFKLQPILNQKIGTYSKGNKQKLGIVSCMMHNPELLILDEPFDGLDPSSIELFRNLLKDYVDSNHSILLCCHSLDFVFELCHRVIVLNTGKVVKEINIKDFKLKSHKEMCDFCAEILK